MPADDPLFDTAFSAARQQVHVLNGHRAPVLRKPGPGLWVEDQGWVEGDLPKRDWIARGYMLRKSVTLIGGMGSAGKSSLIIAYAISLATGIPYGRFQPAEPYKVLIYNVEDDADEQRRRFSAALRQFNSGPAAIAGRVIRCGPEGVGTLLHTDPETGEFVPSKAMGELKALIAKHKPDVVVLDPLVELHDAEENDNTALRAVIAEFRTLAQQHNCAVVLVHHTRKGSLAGDPDSLRGASSIVGAARVVLTVATMTEEEAKELGRPLDLRRRFFRVDSAKSNYAPATEADWHELVEYELDNEETVAAAVPLDGAPASPRQPARDPNEVLALLMAEVARGSPQGPYSPRLAPDKPRSVAALMVRLGIEKPAHQRAALNRLLKEGFTVAEFRDANRIKRDGLRAPDGGPDARWIGADFGAEGDSDAP